MKRPLIGITPMIHADDKQVWLRPNYFDLILDAGGLPLMLPHALPDDGVEAVLDVVDGLLLAGGGDIRPTFYGEEKHPLTQDGSNGLRDALEFPLFWAAWERDLPMLGICRGIQLVNVALGGTLYQDIPDQHPSSVTHNQSAPYCAPVHAIAPAPETPFARLVGGAPVMVNSMHHQGVKDLATDLVVAATAPDGLIEAVWAPTMRFVYAVQWHPEYLPDSPVTQALMHTFIESARPE